MRAVSLVPKLFCVLTIMAAVAAIRPACADGGYRPIEIEGRAVKWGAPDLGRGATVTWRLAFAHGTAPGHENCRRTSGMDGLLQQANLTREDALRAADAAFALWSKVADIRFVPADGSADITIVAEADDVGIAFTDVTPGLAAGVRATSLSRAVICLNPHARWTNAPKGTYRLAYVLAHEIGHAIGLDHPGPTGALMAFEYDAQRERLAPGDIAGAVFLYGPAARIVSAQ
jgi:hypothetical protein